MPETLLKTSSSHNKKRDRVRSDVDANRKKKNPNSSPRRTGGGRSHLAPMKDFACLQYRTTPALPFRSQDRDLSTRAKSFTFMRAVTPTHHQIVDRAPRDRDPDDHHDRRRPGMDLVLPSPDPPSASDRVGTRPVGQKPLPEAVPASASSTSWSTQDDTVLMSARARSHGWSQIQKEHFPTKTPNACRKRYERLVAKRRGPEWDSEKLERLCRHYTLLREQTWRPLADAIGEKWQEVEKAVSSVPSR